MRFRPSRTEDTGGELTVGDVMEFLKVDRLIASRDPESFTEGEDLPDKARATTRTGRNRFCVPHPDNVRGMRVSPLAQRPSMPLEQMREHPPECPSCGHRAECSERVRNMHPFSLLLCEAKLPPPPKSNGAGRKPECQRMIIEYLRKHPDRSCSYLELQAGTGWKSILGVKAAVDHLMVKGILERMIPRSVGGAYLFRLTEFGLTAEV